MSYPRNPYNPQGIDALIDKSTHVESMRRPASATSHGPYTLDEKMRDDNTKLSDLDLPGWQRLEDGITSRCKTIIQYGIANGRFPQRVESMKQKPDMMSSASTRTTSPFSRTPTTRLLNSTAFTTATNSKGIAVIPRNMV